MEVSQRWKSQFTASLNEYLEKYAAQFWLPYMFVNIFAYDKTFKVLLNQAILFTVIILKVWGLVHYNFKRLKSMLMFKQLYYTKQM